MKQYSSLLQAGVNRLRGLLPRKMYFRRLYNRIRYGDSLRPVEISESVVYVDPTQKAGVELADGTRDWLGTYDEIERHGIIPEGGVVLDIGGFWGAEAMYFRELVGNDGAVYTVEPNPTHATMIEKSKQTNEYENVVVVNAAVGETRETNELIVPQNTSKGSTLSQDDLFNINTEETREVEVQTLQVDDVVSRYEVTDIDFIKMDIQGAELNALKRMEETLKRTSYARIQVHYFYFDDEEICWMRDFLAERGELFLVDDDGRIRWETSDDDIVPETIREDRNNIWLWKNSRLGA